ncbi:hypothetical protein MMC07_008558 [Pseudocyphellaria aurata]|nr:hypothetical protein [Pseudocyphellaria aurata]
MGNQKSNVGHIFFLPPKGQISPALLDGVQIPIKAFGHPVLVVHQQQNTVTMLVITSLGWHMPNFFKSHSQIERITAMHIPIAPSPRHRETGLQLEICHGVQLAYRSYVRIDCQYKISVDALHNYPIETRLQAKSMSTVQNQVKRVQSTYRASASAIEVQHLQHPTPSAIEDMALEDRNETLRSAATWNVEKTRKWLEEVSTILNEANTVQDDYTRERLMQRLEDLNDILQKTNDILQNIKIHQT